MRKICIFITCLLLTQLAQSQLADTLSARLIQYASQKNPDLLFVHIDKHIYTNNELLWFSAYLLRIGDDSLSLHQFVSAALVQAGTRNCVIQKKFAMAHGRSSGSIQWPDTIPPGEYKLLVYTNVVGRDSLPVAIFAQPLSIRSIRQSDFSSVMNILNDSAGNRQMYISVSDKNTGAPIRDAEVAINFGNRPIVNVTTDKKGMVIQKIPGDLPGTNSTIVNAKIKYLGDIGYLQTTLPEIKKTRNIDIRFYPEGGNLLTNVPCNIGWETKTDKGEPFALKALLLKNSIVVDTIQTDNSGLGVFTLIPENLVSYSIRPLILPEDVLPQQTGFPLPKALVRGASLHIVKAIVGDSLRFRIYARGFRLVTMVVHNFRNVYVTREVEIGDSGREILLMLQGLPKGLIAITLTDSLSHPLAERIFFAHYDLKARLQIKPDSLVYGKRRKVTLRFLLKNNQQSSTAIASVSCAQANRFERSKQQDIESFAFLESELQNLPAYNKERAYDDAGFLERTLLVRGWRKYNWNEIYLNDANRPLYHFPVIQARVINSDHKIKKPVTVGVIGGLNALDVLATDSLGIINLRYEQLFVQQDKKLLFAPNKGSASENYVKIIDPYIRINDRLAMNVDFNFVDAGRFSRYSEDLLLKEFENIHELPVVVVKSKKDNTIFGSSNKCGDYVCSYNILNCPNHRGNPGNRLPVKGEGYSMPGGGRVVYWGCVLEDENINAISVYEGIKIGKEFYAEEFSQNTSSSPEYISTLFWSPAIVFRDDGTAECTFYTGDIAGRFRIVVNGITDGDVFYATEYFTVR